MNAAQDINIRQAKVEDIDALCRLYLQLIPDARLDPDAMRNTILRMESDGSGTTVFVAVQEGQVVGTLQAVVFDNLVRAPRRRAVLESFVVDEAVRGQGVGTLLLDYVLADLKRRDCAKIIVATAHNRYGAQRLYDKVGFGEFGKSYLLTFDEK